MTELRTLRPDASAAKITSIARPCHGLSRGGAARFPGSGHSNRANGPKPNPDVRRTGHVCLTCGQTSHFIGREDALGEILSMSHVACSGNTKHKAAGSYRSIDLLAAEIEFSYSIVSPVARWISARRR